MADPFALASQAINVELLRTLMAKGLLTRADVTEILETAHENLGQVDNELDTAQAQVCIESLQQEFGL